MADEQIDRIQGFVNEIAGPLQELLKELSDAKQTLSRIEGSVNQRVQNIKDELKVIEKKMFNVQALIFSALEAELGEVVMSSLNKIIDDVDGIIEEDIGSIRSITNGKYLSTFNYITVMLD